MRGGTGREASLERLESGEHGVRRDDRLEDVLADAADLLRLRVGVDRADARVDAARVDDGLDIGLGLREAVEERSLARSAGAQNGAPMA